MHLREFSCPWTSHPLYRTHPGYVQTNIKRIISSITGNTTHAHHQELSDSSKTHFLSYNFTAITVRRDREQLHYVYDVTLVV